MRQRGREEAARIAHSLKSASAMVGAMALSRYAANVEAQTRAEPTGMPSNEDALEMQRLFLAYRKALVDRGLQSPL
jgi:HPt (histidine-containing phosphotransfer) domain-containing protein